MLEVTRLQVGARLQSVSVNVEPGSMLAIVGPNGAGKSTLLRAMLGLERVTGGTVTLDGVSLLSMPARDRAVHLGWLPQQSARADGMTVLEVVAAARFRFRESRAQSEAQATKALTEADLLPLRRRLLTTLSGGERQRVRLAALIAQEARYWLLDEPGNHLDPAAQLDVWGSLVRQCRAGRGVVVVTHDVTLLGFVSGVPAKVLALDAGKAAWCKSLQDEDLPAQLGSLLKLDLRRVDLTGSPRLVVAGRAL